MACFLVTRPRRDSLETARRVRELFHDTTIAPLIEIADVDGPVLDLANVQALLATSANGVRAFVQRQGGPVPKMRVLAVGDATARAAQQVGMYDVISAAGDVDDLARLANRTLDPAAGDVLHVAGTKVAGDLAGMLSGAGFSYRREILYEALPVAALPENAVAAITERTIAGVLLYSPRTARLFTELVARADLGDACGDLDALCLSANVAAALGEASTGSLRRVLVAETPTEDALMAVIRENHGSVGPKPL